MYKFAANRVRVQAGGGEMRELEVFSEPRLCGDTRSDAEPLRWARDAQGRWYSFSTLDATALIESSSGDWFSILA